MAGYKHDRVAEDIKREVAALIRDDIKDPRVQGKLLTVVRAEVSGDLSYCKVNVSAMEGADAAREAVKGLKSASGFISRELGKRLGLRRFPELRFIADDSVEHGMSIAQKLKAISDRENSDKTGETDDR